MPLVYSELRRLAQKLLGRERPGHTLQPTALVHEAYLRLVDQTRVKWQGKTHFYNVAALAMRRLLTEHARRRNRVKRGGGMARVTMEELDEAAHLGASQAVDMLDLDEALERLSSIDGRAGRVAEMRLLAGLTHEEISLVLGIDPSAVERDWRFARARLITLLEAS